MNRSSSCGQFRPHILSILRGQPQATASIIGSENYSSISGTAQFYQSKAGVVALAEISGLPKSENPCQSRIFGFHIHKGTDCGGNMDDPFADAMSHYNPDGCEHPHHAGDLSPLFENNGLALCAFLTNRFSVGRRGDWPNRYHPRPSR